jgi:tetratricopeptide (TPR) repeat protein
VQGLLDFDVAIEPIADGYRARVVGSPAGEAHADFALPFTDTDVENFVLKVGMSIGRGRRQARRIQSDERRLLEEFGDRLFQAAFCGPVRDCLRLSRAVAESRGAGLRIRLRLPGALANVPWEYLYDAQYGFIGLSLETVLVRYVDMAVPVSPFAVSPPLRVLAMISAPEDLPRLQGEQEWGKLTDALADLAERGMVQVDRLEVGTLAALQRPLRLREYHVLHFVGHGVYDEAAQDGALALEGPDGKTRLVTGRDLGLMIRGHRSLRLVVLNACEGARSARDDPLGGVALALVRQGIPAVIAMQFEISDPAALVFSKSFYQAIADGLPVDAAMVEARVAMFAEGHEVEWATPVLYLRSPDGRVFTVGPIPEPDRQARDDADPQARDDADGQVRDDADRQAREDAERRDRELATHYAVACAAADTQDWDQALAWFTRITDVDPGYRDAQERAENARKQQQITRWQAEARRLHRNARWAGVVKVGQRLHALDPAAADPDGLVTSARTKLAAAEQAERLDADYETALRLLDAGDWRQAIQALERVAQVNPAYRATPALLDRARQRLAHTGPPPTPPRVSQKEAEDKAREGAEDKAPEQAAFDLGSLFGGDLSSFFGEGSTTAQRGRHIHAETTLSSTDAAQGGTVTLRLKRQGTCPTCHGTGAKAGSVPRNCSACNGTGKGGKRRISASAKPCRSCHGRGLKIDDPCLGCSGAGRLTSTNTLKVRIPAGVEDGTSLQFGGEGEPSQHGGPAGDLYLLVHVRP